MLYFELFFLPFCSKNSPLFIRHAAAFIFALRSRLEDTKGEIVEEEEREKWSAKNDGIP